MHVFAPIHVASISAIKFGFPDELYVCFQIKKKDVCETNECYATNSYQILMVYLLWLYAILVSRFLACWKIIFNRHFTVLWDVLCASLIYFSVVSSSSTIKLFSFDIFTCDSHTHTHMSWWIWMRFYLFHSAKLKATMSLFATSIIFCIVSFFHFFKSVIWIRNEPYL